MAAIEANASLAPVSGRSSWKRMTLWGCVTGLIAALGLEASSVLVGRNFHALIPGRVYRSAQPGGEELEQTIRTYGIRTVVNLRGCSPWMDWYQEESRATHRMDVGQEDVGLSSGRLPSVTEVRRLVEVLDRTEYPILLHCRHGADRTGLASAVVMLLQTDASLGQARRKLSLRYGHVPLSRPRYLDRFFDLYAEWLAGQGLTHSTAIFRRWLEEADYAKAWRCGIEPLAIPDHPVRGAPTALRVRFRNTGNQTWRLRPGTNAGIHAGFLLYDPQDRMLMAGRSGLFEAEVFPGQSIDLTLVVPPLKDPGTYRLLIDMVDEQQGWFYQTGSEPLERVIQVLPGT